MAVTLEEVVQKLDEVSASLKRVEKQHTEQVLVLKEAAQKITATVFKTQAAHVVATLAPGPVRIFYITAAAFVGGFAAQLAAIYFLHLPR